MLNQRDIGLQSSLFEVSFSLFDIILRFSAQSCKLNSGHKLGRSQFEAEISGKSLECQ